MEKTGKLILLDVDQVVLDLMTPWLEIYNKMYDDNIKPEDIKGWNINTFLKQECGHNIYKILYDNQDLIYKKVKPIEGALDGINEIKKMGFEIVYCTSGIMMSKVDTLARYGLIPDNYRDKVWSKNIIVTPLKKLINGLLVDDYHENIKEGDILLKQSWSDTEAHNGYNADSWSDVIKIIEEKYL